MQQFGRGLRKAEGKSACALSTISAIIERFYEAQTLLNCSVGDRALALRFEEVIEGRAELPPRLPITYDL